MRDPFRPNTNKQLVREAQFGFTVIGLLIAVLIYVAYYRINGVGNTMPPHIRDAPVAMQVFPNSPNYDPHSHSMLPRAPDPRLANLPSGLPSNPSVSSFPTRQKSPLVETPKRMMEDSKNTFRSLSKSARSIEASAAKVQSLASTPVSKKSVGLISNPASESVKESGFKVAKKPKPDIATSKLPKATSQTNEPKLPKPNSLQSLLSKFAPSKQSAPPKKVSSPEKKPSNDFKPLSPKPTASSVPVANPLLSKLNKIASAAVAPVNAPIKTTPQDSNTLRQNNESFSVPPPAFRQSSAPRPETESPAPEFVAPTTIETVSFEETTWTVKKGDSFWSIAQSHYGDGRFFRALYEQNRRIVPGFENLTAGTELFLPSVDNLIRQHADLCPSDSVRKDDPWRATPKKVMDNLTEACEADLDQRLYETKPGDTLFGIARQQLGQASRYVELLKLNEYRIDGNMTHESSLPPGTKLLLPIK